MSGEVGKTKDVGYEIGVSRTVAYPVDEVWDFLVGPQGLALWLGRGVRLSSEKGSPYETADGTVGEVRGYHPLDRVRVTWWPAGWSHESTVQIALSSTGPSKTRVVFHQERLVDATERALQREHWQRVADALEEALAAK